MVRLAMLGVNANIPGLSLVAGYLAPDEQAELLELVDNEPWSSVLKRRVQHYGYRYDYKNRSIDRNLFLGLLPRWAEDIAERLLRAGYVSRPLNQLIVNEYLPGQGISRHVDHVSYFSDQVLSLSLGSSCVLMMRSEISSVEVPVALRPGTLLILSGEARYGWSHGIPARKSDLLDGERVARERRISLTFRTVIE